MYIAIYKRTPIDFNGDYRSVIHERVEKSRKKHRTEVELSKMQNADDPSSIESVLVFFIADDEQEPTGIPVSDVTGVRFVVDGDNCYAEINALINDAFVSLLLYPEDDFYAISEEYNELTDPDVELVEYGQQKVIDFNSLCASIAEAANVEMVEYILDNPWELIPDDAGDGDGGDYDDFDGIVGIPPVDDEVFSDELANIESAIDNDDNNDGDINDNEMSPDFDSILDADLDDFDATGLLETIAGISGDMSGTPPTEDFGIGVNEEYSEDSEYITTPHVDANTSDSASDGSDEEINGELESILNDIPTVGNNTDGETIDTDDDDIADMNDGDTDEVMGVDDDLFNTGDSDVVLTEHYDGDEEKTISYDEEIGELTGSFNKIMDDDMMNDYVPASSTPTDGNDGDTIIDGDNNTEDNDSDGSIDGSVDENTFGEFDHAAIDNELADMKQLISATVNNLDVNLDDIERHLVGGEDVEKSIDSYLNTVERPSDGFVRELAEKISEQNKEIAQLQAALMSEQATSREATEKIAKLTIVIEEQQRQIDKLMRDLHFANQNRQKAEEYISEAKRQVEQVLAKARLSIETARRNMDRMQEHVDRKEKERALAAEQLRTLEIKLDAANAEMEREREQLRMEKEHASKVVEDADQRVSEFTREMTKKLSEHINRTRAAESKNEKLSVAVKTLQTEYDELSTSLDAEKQRLLDKTAAMNRLLAEKDANYNTLRKNKEDEIARLYQQQNERFDAMVLNKDAVIKRLASEKSEVSNALIDTTAKLTAKSDSYNRLQTRYSVLSNSLSSLTVSTGNAYRERDTYAVFVDEERARVEEGVGNLRRVLSEKPKGFFKRKAKWEALQTELEEFLNLLAEADDTVSGARAHLEYARAKQTAGRDPYSFEDLVPDEPAPIDGGFVGDGDNTISMEKINVESGD